jgi:light-regulated signal transduction histidine kinase (bacteriophytochrome)
MLTVIKGMNRFLDIGMSIIAEAYLSEKKSIIEDQKQQQEKINNELIQTLEVVNTKNQELERFAYVASHDLQEPLRMVSSFLHLLEENLGDSLSATNKKYIDFAVDGAERMKGLIQDLLQYARVSSSKEDLIEVDCNEIITNVKAIYELTISEANAILRVNALPKLKGVKSQIRQVFQNLVGNALKYRGKDQCVIEVGYEDKGNAWQFYVKDNGIGIDPVYFEKIFVIFQRLHNKDEYSGTGIGLSVCKKIIEKHGGNIWVESQPNNGSAFYFTISKN